MSLTFCAFALQRHKPEAEGKDGNKYEDAQADIKSGRLADERVITFRAQSYDVDKGLPPKNICTAFRKIGLTLPFSSDTEMAE